jgi:hypothetical protein
MNIMQIAKRAGKLASDNSPALLTALGVTGAVTAAYLTGKATFKAAEIIAASEAKPEGDDGDYSLEPMEKVELTWKLFVPAVGTLAITVAAIIAANHISTRRVAAFASAYNLSEKAFEEYKKKVIEKVGVKKEQAVRDAVAQDRVNEYVAANGPVYVVSGRVLCMDLHSGRTFNSDMESIKAAVNETNAQVISDNYASLSDLYDRIGLTKTAESDNIGWNTDELLAVEYSTALTEDNQPCITIGFRAKPVSGFYRLH